MYCYHRNKISLLLFGLFLQVSQISCADKPKVEDDKYFSPNVVHERFTEQCSECHEQQRLTAVDGIAHGFGRDCEECHTPSDTPSETVNLWQPKPFSHSPDPVACLGCHGLDRPTRESHPQTGDCVTCHKYPAWLPPII